MNFTPNQLEAINHHHSNLQLIACAGSGKTEIVARRVAAILKTGAKPGNIIAFTYTDKAAAELKERIITRCQEELGSITGMAEMYVGTIHAFCLDLLKTEVPKYLKFDVLNDVQQILFIDRHSQKSGLTRSTDLNGDTLHRYVDTKRYRDALSILREGEPNVAKLANCSIVSGLADYEDLLDGKSYFDYTSIMESAVGTLTNDQGIRQRLADRVRHVIVDEYQDLNPIQEAIVWSLHELGAKICVVGDDDQTIYQWRGSNVSNILTFSQRYPGVHEIRLEENWRSTVGVVETARTFIEQNTARLPKQMQPTNAQDYEPGDIVALSFDAPDQEADYIVQTIQSLRGVPIKDPTNEQPGHLRGISWSDMAILLRSVRKNAEPITRALRIAGIPFIVAGMSDLFETAEVKACRALFYFMDSRPSVPKSELRNAWLAANLGLNVQQLQVAIAFAANLRVEFLTSNIKKRFALQRFFFDFLERAGVREDLIPNVPPGRGEIVFYNLGKFSQVITDFEQINYHSAPLDLYSGFAKFLEHQAEDAYPEGWQDNAYANPDAVRIMTVHQAKGMQWPVVFIPALLRNRFPSAKQRGKSVWHLLPRDAIKDQTRYEGSTEDERRLFYVAMTRSQKYLHLTWAPIPGFNGLYQKRSVFWDDILVSTYVKRKAQDYIITRPHLAPTPRQGIANVIFTFSDLKYLFECPYMFKLRILYGFNHPIHEELGFGRSLHNALADVHARALRHEPVTDDLAEGLVTTHLHLPFSNSVLREKLANTAVNVVRNYIIANKVEFPNLEFAEKQVQISLGDGISVIGRIDLVRRKDTGKTYIVDLKSTEQSQQEQATELQLHVYALGYQELTGRHADYVEIYELDDGDRKQRSVDDDFVSDVITHVQSAADQLRKNNLPHSPTKSRCQSCDHRGLCSPGLACCP